MHGYRSALAGIVLGASFLGFENASAEQFIVLDHTEEFTRGRFFKEGGLVFKSSLFHKSVAKNWVEPINYRDSGYWHLRMEISDMAAGKSAKMGTFRFMWGHYGSPANITAITSSKIHIAGNGVFTSSGTIASMCKRAGWFPPPERWRETPKNVSFGPSPLRDATPFTLHITVIVSTSPKVEPVGSFGGLYCEDIAQLERAASHWKYGRIGVACLIAQKSAQSAKKGEAEDARRILEAAERYRQKRLEELTRRKARDPLGAIERLIELATQFRPAKEAVELIRVVRAWEKEPAVKIERRAQAVYVSFQRTASDLRRRLRGKKASDPKMSRRFGGMIVSVRRHVQALYRRFPDTGAFRSAVGVARSLGIELPQPIVERASQGKGKTL